MHLLYGNEKTEPAIRYLTGFTAPDDVLVIIDKNEVTLIVSDLEYGRALEQAKNCTVHTPKSLFGKHISLVECIALYGKTHNYDEATCEYSFPYGIVWDLYNHFKFPVLVSEEDIIPKMRVIKTEEEIEKIAAVQKVTHLAMDAAGKLIASAHPSSTGELVLPDGTILSSEVVRHKIRMVCMENDCIDEGTIVAGGLQGVNPHEEGHGPLYANEWIVVDIFPRSLSTGYWGDMTRTFMNGTPTAEQKRQYDIVKKAHDSAIRKVHDGVVASRIHKSICQLFEKNGFMTEHGENGPEGFFHSTGHGVGLEIHEEPRISVADNILRSNMVVTIEPGLYYAATGGVRIEDLIVVTADGARVL